MQQLSSVWCPSVQREEKLFRPPVFLLVVADGAVLVFLCRWNGRCSFSGFGSSWICYGDGSCDISKALGFHGKEDGGLGWIPAGWSRRRSRRWWKLLGVCLIILYTRVFPANTQGCTVCLLNTVFPFGKKKMASALPAEKHHLRSNS